MWLRSIGVNRKFRKLFRDPECPAVCPDHKHLPVDHKMQAKKFNCFTELQNVAALDAQIAAINTISAVVQKHPFASASLQYGMYAADQSLERIYDRIIVRSTDRYLVNSLQIILFHALQSDRYVRCQNDQMIAGARIDADQIILRNRFRIRRTFPHCDPVFGRSDDLPFVFPSLEFEDNVLFESVI